MNGFVSIWKKSGDGSTYAVGKVKKKLDYNNQGGALFLGVEKPVVKAHGASKSKAFKNAVLQAVGYAEKDMPAKIKEKLSAVDLNAVKVER